jgi:hypothetical protein
MSSALTCMIVSILFCGMSIQSVAASKPADWRNDDICGRRLPAPVEVEIRGCEKASCTQISGRSRICACLPTSESDEGNIFIEKSGKVLVRWNARLFTFSDEPIFRVDAADLRRDGKEELVVGAMETVSNGMGRQYWTVWAVSEATISNPIAVEDYGIFGFLTRQKGEKTCNLLATRWMEGFEPHRGDGLYLAGRWFSLCNGNLTPYYDRPIIYRRYLKSFERQRNKAISEEHPKPILWFRDTNTKPLSGPYPPFE